jgi:hypothetical protein
MDSFSLASIAKVAAEDFRRGRGDQLDGRLAQELAMAIELALLTAVRSERRACADECSRRAVMWERTAEHDETSEFARDEARSRANEALYLADLIRARGSV